MATNQGFFVLTSSEDGISIDGPLTDTQLKKWLKDRVEDSDEEIQFAQKIPPMDKGYFESGYEDHVVIIHGSVIVPQAAHRTVEWKLPK